MGKQNRASCGGIRHTSRPCEGWKERNRRYGGGEWKKSGKGSRFYGNGWEKEGEEAF